MDKNSGHRTERTKAEIDAINKEISKVENLGARPRQLRAKDTSHGRVSEMIIQENGIQRANILYRPNKVMIGKEVSAADLPVSAFQIGWRRKAAAADIVVRTGRKKEKQKKSGPSKFPELQGAEPQEGKEETGKRQDITIIQQAEPYYPTAPSLFSVPSALTYPTLGKKSNFDFPSGKKMEKITGRKNRLNKQEDKKHNLSNSRIHFCDRTVKKAVDKPINKDVGKIVDRVEGKEKVIGQTSCHDGRKSGQQFSSSQQGIRLPTLQSKGVLGQACNKSTINQENMFSGKSGRRIKAIFKGKSIVYAKKDGLENYMFLSAKKINSVDASKNGILVSSSKEHRNKERGITFCHNGRKLTDNSNASRKGLKVEGKKTEDKTYRSKNRVESSLCASYRTLKKTGTIAASTGQKAITVAAAISESMSSLSEEGGELQAVSAAAFVVKDTVGCRVSDKWASKKVAKSVKKCEGKRDTLLEQKAEIKKLTTKMKTDGTSLSKEEIAMLEKKLGIASKKDKGENKVSDKRNKKLQKMQKANNKKVKKIESKLKNIPRKTSKELRKRNLSAQMRYQARSYAIRRLTDPNNEAEGTGLGGMLLSLVKTGGVGFSKKALKAIGSLLLKVIAPMLPIILAITVVPILCLLLIGGIAGGKEEENLAHAQETFPGEDYYLSSLNVLYGHANNTVTGNTNIMKWKPEVKRELARQGLDKSWTDMVLCMMWQESKGLGNDIMQSGGATPKDSIRAGVSVIKSALAKCAQYKSNDIKLALYCYNYGPGFADYIYKDWDGICSEEAAQARTDAMLASHPEWSMYGDPKYAQHVLQNYVFEENPDVKLDSSKWCEADKNNVSKCTLTSVTSYACKFIGNKYVWGGNSLTNGCDCSGFTQQVYKHFGIDIPRTSSIQSQNGRKIQSLSEAIPGDLLFYGDNGTVSHVALYLGNNTIVHASNSAPYPSGGIKTTNPADYRPILAIRRYSK